MTAAAKPLPAHGTYARANGSPRYRKPCKCEPCLVARRRHDKKWKVNRALGKPAMVDAAPAREHIAELRKTRTWASISTTSGIAQSNLYRIANGSRTEIQRTTRDAILAAQPGPKPVETLQIDALGSRRRLQALMFVGHSVRLLARECRVSKDRAHDIALGLQPTVRADVAERIADAYVRLAFRAPALNKFTNRTRNLAAKRGWHGPLAWDDIDNPDCEPETEDGAEPPRRRSATVDPHAVARLTALGRTNEQIAVELGCHERTVSRARKRAEMQAAA
jgi:hypothetical protein